MTQSLNLAVIPGDGIGPEVIAEALETLDVVSGAALDMQVTHYSLGASHYLETGEILSDETLQSLSTHDAILLGAVGGDPRDPQLQGESSSVVCFLGCALLLITMSTCVPPSYFPVSNPPCRTRGLLTLW